MIVVRALALIWIWALVGPDYARADDWLTGFRAIDVIVVKGMDEDGIKCGLDEGKIMAAAELQIRSHTKISIGLEEIFKNNGSIAESARLTISLLTSTAPNGLCVSHITFRLAQVIEITLAHQKKPLPNFVNLFQTASLLQHDPKKPKFVTDAVEDMAKEFSLAWLKSNR